MGVAVDEFRQAPHRGAKFPAGAKPLSTLLDLTEKAPEGTRRGLALRQVKLMVCNHRQENSKRKLIIVLRKSIT